jgi:hypothetical protein
MKPRKDNQPKRWWVLTPTMGICLFGVLYGMAACQYPGGSNFDQTTTEFSWQHNYWCDLLGNTGKNGAVNPARPTALLAMVILGGSLSVFWFLLPLLHGQESRFIRLSQWAGGLSMGIILFIGTPYHDVVMNVAGGFGLIALMATFLGLYQSRLFWLISFGLFCIALVGLNNYVYYSNQYIFYLPVIQKITFAFFLLWIVLINGQLYRKARTHLPL